MLYEVITNQFISGSRVGLGSDFFCFLFFCGSEQITNLTDRANFDDPDLKLTELLTDF